MNFFLRIRHWQFFLITFALPLVLEACFIPSVIFSQTFNPDIIVVFSIMMLIMLFMQMGWSYTIGTNLHKRLPPGVSMPLKRFKWFLFIPVVYIALILLVFMPLILKTMDIESPDNSIPLAISAALLLIIPLHLFSIFCLIYTLYFNAKSLKAVETRKPVTFSDFAGEFFLLWFFPVGVWIIQPRINKIFSEEPYDPNFPFMNDTDYTS
ncbi:hypothetical protein D3C72_772550 [compost metagenome]